MAKVKINEKEYELSPLKVKHLRKITEMLEEKPASLGLFSTIERWAPFVVESIQATTPNFTSDDLSEGTLQELVDAWDILVKLSGIKFISGEAKPTGQKSTGASSMDASPVPSDGTIVQ